MYGELRTELDPRLVQAFNQAHSFKLEHHLILLARIGSHSHGTYVPPTDPQAIDDVDYLGIVIPPANCLLGLQNWEHWVWKFEELDVVLYSLEKAVRLLLKSNPNIMGLLWLRPEEYCWKTWEGALLLKQREAFSSLEAYPAFMGYAYDQLKRMEHFDEAAMARYEELRATLEGWVNVDAWLSMNGAEFQEKIKSPYAFTVNRDLAKESLVELRRLHRKHFSGYLGEKRKRLVRQFGYDTKNAAHLIRLMRMCVDYLRTGRLEVYRTHDAEILKAIKQGAWTLKQVKEEARTLFAAAEQAKRESPLPAEPDRERAEELLLTLHQAAVSPRAG